MGMFHGPARRSSVTYWIKFAILGVLLTVALQGANCEQEPTESQCRPYIERALKEQHTQVESGEESEEDSPTSTEQEDPPTDELTDSAEATNEDRESEEGTGEDDNENDDETVSEGRGEETDETKDSGEDDQDDDDNDDDKTAEQSEAGEEDASVEGDTKEESGEEEGGSVEGDTEEQADEEGERQEAGEPGTEEQESGEGDDDDDDEVEGDTQENEGSVEGDTQEEEAASIEGDTAEQDDDEADTGEAEGSVEGDTAEQDDEGDSVEGDTKEEDADEEEGDSVEGDTREDDADEEESVEGDTEEKEEEDGEDGSVEGDTREEDEEESVEGDTKEEEEASIEGDTKEDDEDTTEKAESVEGDTKEEDDASVEGDTKEEEDASVEGDTKEDEEESVEGDTKEDEEGSVEGDTKEEEEGSVEGDTKEEEGSVEGDTREEGSVEGDTKEEEGDTKEDEAGESVEGDTKEEGSDEGAGEKDQAESGEEGATEEADDSDEDKTKEDSTPEEEDLIKEVVIPENLRPRDHITKILRLDEESVETESALSKAIDSTLKTLKNLYDNAIKPLEILYKYRDLSNRHFGDPEIFSKPLILFMGPWSGGKSSTINYLLNNEFTSMSLRTGAEPSPAYFNIMMYGSEEEVLDGTQLAADWTFSGLQKFGQGLLDRLRGVKLPNRLLEKVNIVEIPGILEIRKQVQRLFPFNDACQWFIDRADIIFLVYDPAKLDVGPETEAILDQLKGREYQTRIILNKADQVKPEELMRVQGTLIWNISPLMSSTEPPVMYTTSLWSLPYETWAPARLLLAQERAFLRDLREAIDKRVENKIASARRFAVRVRNHAKMVDCYLTTYYNHKTFFGNRKKTSDDIIEFPQKYHIYEGLSTLTNISRYDLPDPDVYRDFFKINPLYDFTKLSDTCTYFRGCPINKLDIAIAYDLPELVGKYKKAVEAAKDQVGKTES